MTATVETEELYSAMEVVQLTGVTYRQLDHWAKSGRLHATVPAFGTGTRRQFSDHDIARVRYVIALIETGFTVDAALQIAQHLDDGRAFCKVAGQTVAQLAVCITHIPSAVS
jgi:DNA-binding transcriptional MerR regulator